MPLTVTQLKAMFQEKIAPARDDEFLRLLQEAEIRLLETGKWMWCRKEVTLTPVEGIITLDPEYAAILAAQVEGYPTPINSLDFEFTPDGMGEIEVTGGHGLRLIDQELDGEERRYKVVGRSSTELNESIVALVHKAPATLYDPDASDSGLPDDVTANVTCPDAGAIKLCMLALLMEEAHDLDSSRGYMATCYARLNDRQKTRRGNAQQTPNVRPQGKGVRGIRTFR